MRTELGRGIDARRIARGLVAAIAASLAGCFSPSFHDPSCGPGGACPSGYTCSDGTTCNRQVTGDVDAPPGDADAGVDADPSAPDAAPTPACWMASNVDPCGPTLPRPTALSLATGSFTYDTTTGALGGGGAATLPSALVDQKSGPPLRVVNLSSIDLGAGVSVVVTGEPALVIVVHGDATLAGVIDVRAVSGKLAHAGPGTSEKLCVEDEKHPGRGGDGFKDGGGGGGGAYGAAGGNADKVSADDNHSRGGTAAGTGELIPLRGGCGGGNGIDALGTVAATGGGGGGAFEITAHGRLTVSGTIHAGGAAGETGSNALASSGGGGGAGGAILLEATEVAVTAAARLCANGGGGGGGSGLGADAPAEDATCSETVGARGAGTGGARSGGGIGGYAAGPAGGDAKAMARSGLAGGGSVGRIRIRNFAGDPAIVGESIVSPIPVTR